MHIAYSLTKLMKKLLSILKDSLPVVGTILLLSSPWWIGYGCSVINMPAEKKLAQEQAEKERKEEKREEIRKNKSNFFFNQYEKLIIWDSNDDEFQNKFTIDLQEEAEQNLIGFMGDVTDIQKINGEKYITFEMESSWFSLDNNFVWNLKCDRDITPTNTRNTIKSWGSLKNSNSQYGVIADISEIKKETIMVPTEDDEGGEYLSEEERVIINGKCVDIININKAVERELSLEEIFDKELKINELDEQNTSSLIFNYSEIYCLMRMMENSFWNDYNYKYEEKRNTDDSDIPTMRELGGLRINDIKELNIKELLTQCEKTSPEGCKPLTEAFFHLTKFLEKSSTLESFEQFKADAGPHLEMFRMISKRAPSYLEGKFEDSYDQLSLANKTMLGGMEHICNVRIQQFQGGMSYQPKNKEAIIEHLCSENSHLEDGSCACDKGYAQSLDNSYCVRIPENAHAVDSDTDVWICNEGFIEYKERCFEKETPEDRYIMAAIFIKEHNDYDLALNAINDAINGGLHNKNTFSLRSSIKMHQKDFSGALLDLGTAIQLGYYDKNMYQERAAMKISLEDFEGALNDFNTAIKIDPNGRNYTGKGMVESLLGLDYEACLDWATAAHTYNEKKAKELYIEHCFEL